MKIRVRSKVASANAPPPLYPLNSPVPLRCVVKFSDIYWIEIFRDIFKKIRDVLSK